MSLDPQLIDRGTPNGGDGDDARTGAQKINENFEHLFETKGEVITFLMADNSVEEVVSRINTLPLFEIKYPASALIKATIIYDPADPPDEITTKIYKIVGRQGGNFGTGTTAVTTANLQLINTVLSGAEDFEADASTVVIDYGDLGTTTVIDHINALAPSETIAAPTTNLTIIKATVNSVLEEYLFIGAAGDYGLNDTAITASDLQLIEDDFNVSNENFGYIVIPETFDWTNIPSNYANSILVIKYDFDLGNGNITLPANVTLKFNGGSLSNYNKITGNRTRIDAGLAEILDNPEVDGSWIIDGVFVEWFGAIGNGTTDDATSINNSIQFALKSFSSNVYFQGKNYSIESPIKWKQTTNIIGKSISSGNVGGTTILCNFSQSVIDNPPTDIYQGTYAVVLDHTPIIYNGGTGVITQCYMQDIRLDGNDLDVYGFYVNEMYYTNLNRVQITQCNESPFTVVKSQFCQIDQLTVVSSSGPIRIINSTSTLINGLDVEGITGLEDSWLQIVHDLNKTGITINGLHYEESAGGTGTTVTDWITIGQRGVNIINPQVTISATGQERYLHLLPADSIYNYDGISIATTNQANNCSISSQLIQGDIKIKLASDSTEFNVIGDLPIAAFETLTGTGREKFGTQKFGLDWQILNPNSGDKLFGLESLTSLKWGNGRWDKSAADNILDSTAGNWKIVASGGSKKIDLEGVSTQILPSTGVASDGDWEDGLFRLGGYYFWLNASGELMRSSGQTLPTSDTDGIKVGILGTAVEDATVNTNQTIAPETNQSYFWNLTGNIDLTIDETTLSNGETVTLSIETTSDTNTETLTVTNAGANLYGSFDATKVNKITIEASKLATAGFKLNVFFNQPE